LPTAFYIFFFFALGSSIGSFLNVVVYRLPRGQSLVHPPSRCPQCEHKLAWYDNLPVIGWIMLGGKCRYCKKPISPRYPIVEAITGLLFVAFYAAIFIFHQGPFWAAYDDRNNLIDLRRMTDLAVDWPIFGLYLFSLSALLATSLIDAELYLIPAPLPLLMAGAGVLVHTFVDRAGTPGALVAGPMGLAFALGASLGLILSIILLRMKILPLSFAQGESPLEIDKLNRKPEDEELPDYTPAQVRVEIAKELLFLCPPLVLGGIAVLTQLDGAPLHDVWLGASKIDWLNGLLSSLLGGLVGGGVVWLTRIFGSLAFGKEAMGLGDVDLMFGVGAVVGPGAAAVAFLLAPFFGMPLALGMYAFKSRRQLPYVPYLSMATVVLMLFYFPIYDYLRPGVIGLGTILRSLW
jgi:leader peptidase (prepilin peptidase) / N-methyltransferase